MKWRGANGLKWLEFEILSKAPGLVHATFSRHGGVSRPPFHTLNLSESVGDRQVAVAHNLQRIKDQLQLKRLLRTKQVHGTTLVDVSIDSPDCVEEADGLITQDPDIGLLIKHADCQAAIIYDPKRRVVACVHAGWRGLVKNIYAVTVNRLASQYGCQREDLLIAIAPSLGPDGAEFIHYREEFPESFWAYQIKPHYFDLWAIAEQQLLAEGVRTDHIEITRVSTYSHTENFFSHRGEGRSGRNGTVVALI